MGDGSYLSIPAMDCLSASSLFIMGKLCDGFTINDYFFKQLIYGKNIPELSKLRDADEEGSAGWGNECGRDKVRQVLQLLLFKRGFYGARLDGGENARIL